MSVIVVFYSRYSSSSLNFLSEIEKIMEVRKLCVDNENVRTQILEENESYNIECVPSVLIFHSNGFLEKQKGDECFEWLEKVRPQPPVVEEEKIMEEVKPISKKKMERMSVEDLEYESTRKMDTIPLVLKEENTDKNDVDDKIKEDRENQAQNNIKKNTDQGNIMSVAQQMQKERELEVKE
jgi:hypothetical protein